MFYFYKKRITNFSIYSIFYIFDFIVEYIVNEIQLKQDWRSAYEKQKGRVRRTVPPFLV